MNLPNSLTIARIFIVPLLVVALLTPVAEDWFGVTRYTLGIVFFLAGAVTDFFDGHLARRRNQVSKLGILLDPVADKLLVSAAFIVLVEKHLAPAWAVVIILGREFAVTGLRSIAASDGLIISANKTAKIKMWAQCVAIVSLMVAGANSLPPVSNVGSVLPSIRFYEIPEIQTAFEHLLNFRLSSDDWRIFGYLIGRTAMWIAVIASLWSMYEYFALFRRADKERKEKLSEMGQLSESLIE